MKLIRVSALLLMALVAVQSNSNSASNGAQVEALAEIFPLATPYDGSQWNHRALMPMQAWPEWANSVGRQEFRHYPGPVGPSSMDRRVARARNPLSDLQTESYYSTIQSLLPKLNGVFDPSLGSPLPQSSSTSGEDSIMGAWSPQLLEETGARNRFQPMRGKRFITTTK